MRISFAIVAIAALMIACKSAKTKREGSPSSATALDVSTPSGCGRRNLPATGWIEIKCDAGGDKHTFIHVAFSENADASADAYIARRKLDDWKDTQVTVSKQEKLADGWLAVFAFEGDSQVLVDSVRQIAGRSIGCGASMLPAGEVDRVIATCKSVSY